MATIKPIEARSVHQIQSGQVIVDLCSVVKELVENSLDAGATSVEVRFKNNGLDSIEVQDNGSGISPGNYSSLALKHHTSKLASYEDLSSLRTFGFRGEALSSLCALSTFHVITAMADEAPKGKKLDFASSGNLKTITVVAAQKGTTAVVEGLFEQLPVRRKELTKNIKKEYGKVLGLLHAYACICTNVKITVKSAMGKGKNAVVFATKANPTTRENIANVYGAKTLSALVPLELQLDSQRSPVQGEDAIGPNNKIIVRGHVSRPVFGEGRQTPDRQMFFVNGRPCGLPQIAKAINEVYKSFNVSQSPFIFADFNMDTNAYDVNVSPDKRTIMLHDAVALVEALKSSLTELFEQQEQTIPQTRYAAAPLPTYKQLTFSRESKTDFAESDQFEGVSSGTRDSPAQKTGSEKRSLLHSFSRSEASTREESRSDLLETACSSSQTEPTNTLQKDAGTAPGFGEYDDLAKLQSVGEGGDHKHVEKAKGIRARDFNMRIAEQEMKAAERQPVPNPAIERADSPFLAAAVPPLQENAVQNAFNRVRPVRPTAEIATITVGDRTMTTMVGSLPQTSASTRKEKGAENCKPCSNTVTPTQAFTRRLRGYAAPRDPIATTHAELCNTLKCPHEDNAQELALNMDEVLTENTSLIASVEEPEDAESDGGAGSDNVELIRSLQDETYGGFIDETEKRAREDATVAALIRSAEEKAISLNINNPKHPNRALKSERHNDSTTSLQVRIATSVQQIRELTSFWQLNLNNLMTETKPDKEDSVCGGENEEDHLALTVSKIDFSNMHIVGQFNLGFILAVRPSSYTHGDGRGARNADELFIVDQHASDEKYNFEKLQAETVVSNQRLVCSKQLDLTAVEEEILMENSFALEKNGFLVSVSGTEDEPIGRRCKLVSLPLSKEVTFGLEDLEELLHLLAESPGLSQSSLIPRPSKVRKMFAMRACRSSIMIGKALTEIRMRTVISHMGEIDKPWNCPHGRPTMRHLVTLNTLPTWQEGDGIPGNTDMTEGNDLWSRYARK